MSKEIKNGLDSINSLWMYMNTDLDQCYDYVAHQIVSCHGIGVYCYIYGRKRKVNLTKKKKKKKNCTGGESNPGLPRGRREFYH